MFFAAFEMVVVLVKLFLFFCFVLWVLIPLIFYYNPYIASKIVFFYMYYCPYYSNLQDFELFGLSKNYCRNFYLPSIKDEVKLGFWHILPESQRFDDLYPVDMEMMLDKGDPVVLYLHGNALNRGGRHIVDMYKTLASLGFHVIAVDYRGYGDSEGTPWDEDDVVNDALTAWQYVKRVTAGKSPIFVWGHSLGTGIASSLLRRLAESGEKPEALFLESPFTTLREATKTHPLSRVYSFLPYFEEVFLTIPDRINVRFNTVENLLHVDCPIMLLHSKDDHIVPYHFAKQLHEVLKREKGTSELVLFPSGRGYYHVDMWKAPDFKATVMKFVSKVLQPPRQEKVIMK